MPARLKRLTIGMLLLCAFSAAAACEWPAWQQYKQFYVSEQGRVIERLQLQMAELIKRYEEMVGQYGSEGEEAPPPHY